MCGILAIFNFKGTYQEARKLGFTLSRRQRHRGPDRSSIQIIPVEEGIYHVLAHERLNIVDLSDKGRQPFALVEDPKIVFMQNGETYNYWDLIDQLKGKYRLQSHSDSEIAGVLYKEHGPHEFWKHMDGMGATVLYDGNTKRYYAGRDHIGIISMYYGLKNGTLFISSELKAIHDQVDTLAQFPPGHYITNEHEFIKWYNPQWHDIEHIPTGELDYAEIRQKFINVVRREIKGDAPFGLFISGGVDSSIVAGIVAKLIKNGEIDIQSRGMKKVHSFCIGLEGSPDLHYAKIVAEYLGFEHHSYTYTVEEGLDYIPEVIYHTETFNNTTIRASTPLYQMCRRIKAMGIKVCLTGEGSDEMFGGYLYFHKAPNPKELHQETVRKLQDLYKYDLLRACKSCLAFGIEVRPPFLNRDWIEYVQQIDPKYKMTNFFEKPIEKYILRKAFDTPEDPFVPSAILWRQKEQFSDGVGYNWKDGLIKKVNEEISDEQFEQAAVRFPVNPPRDKEQYWYRSLFESYFPSEQAVLTVPYARSIACSTEKALEWDEAFKKNVDESGRAVIAIHQVQVKEEFKLEQVEETLIEQTHFLL